MSVCTMKNVLILEDVENFGRAKFPYNYPF